jgi:hypothetical protein
MMHALGRLVLAGRLPEQYGQVMARLESGGRSLFDLEREILGATHAEVGGYLLGLWGLPQRIVEAITHYGEPAKLDATRLGIAGAVYVASVLARDPEAPLSREEGGVAGDSLSEVYLGATGALDRLPAFRALARAAPR